jgi:uncharacterized protein (TIGR03437 family)
LKVLLFLVLAGTSGLLAQPAVMSVQNTLSPNQTPGAALCPGILASIYGTGFGTSASAVAVTVGNQPAYVLTAMGEVRPTQINVQFPYNVPAGQADVVVTVGGVSAAPVSVTLQPVAPTLQVSNGIGVFVDPKENLLSASNLASAGEALSVYMTGLGPTDPAVSAGPAPSTGLLKTASLPTITIGGLPANVLTSTMVNSDVGLYQVNFMVPAGAQGDVPFILTIDGEASNTVTLPIFGISAIVNGGSFLSTGTAAPGEYVTLYANGLGSKDQLYAFPSTMVQGISVTFNGIAAPIADVVTENGQVNLIVPSGLPTTGTIQVQLTTPTGTGPNFPLIMDAAVPGIFLVNDPANANADIAVAQFSNTTWLVVPTSAASALGLAQNCTASSAPAVSNCGQPAAPGDYVILYLTGLGAATPNGSATGTPLATGVVAPASGSPLYETTAMPTVQLGGTAVTVLFSGITPGTAGEYQINFQVPTGVTEGDSVPITVSMPGSTTAMATMAIHSR